ncbi:MAG: Signal transduction histidine kinase [Nitrospirae bacterium]|nr:MAG: Signal transduction histidine kinase [Nitrospirota bacterium]
MQKWIKKYLAALLIAPVGYIFLLGYLYYDYTEHNRDVAGLIKHLTETHVADILMHGMIFLAPVISTIIAILFQQTVTGYQKKYEIIINSIEGIAWEVDVKTFMFTFVSKQAEQLLGYPVKQWLNEPFFWQGHIHPEDREQAVAFRINQTKGKKDHEFEYRMIASDGSIKWIRDSVSVLLQNGESSKLHGIMADITERKKAEEALKESEEHYRLLFQQSPLGVFHYDTNLLLTDCNDRFAEILQSPREKLVGLDMKTLKDQNVLPAIRVSLAGDDGAYEGFYRATTSPAEIWISMRTAPLFDNKGAIKGGVGLVEDITYRKLAEKEVKEKVRELEKFYDMAVNRELKMKELKEELASLKAELSKYRR